MSQTATPSHADGKPYPGLRPYREDEQGNFFGREADTKILIDKILVHRLTLLFAATGVGKSSLLQAAALPYLKSPRGENLDVVYYIDWVSNPLSGVKQAVHQALQTSGSWRPEITYTPKPDEKLVDFLGFCALFTRQPLIVVLDQFEEFFRYQRGRETFEPFLEQLTGVISHENLPVHLVFSMREDFALELDAFKKYMPLSVFGNLYRLEKLKRDTAQEAILRPLLPIGFQCEPELLQQLLKDLLSRELSRNSNNPLAETEVVEPPYLQIICIQLWEREQGSPDKTLHLKTYQEAGGAIGLLDTYLQTILKNFSESEKELASQAFDHLISHYGAKFAYRAEDLAQIISVDEFELRQVLEKLTQVRVLRSQNRDNKVWYEVYHDMFTDSVRSWNKKRKQYNLEKPPSEHIKDELFKLTLQEKIIASSIFNYIARDQAISFIFTLNDIATILNKPKEIIKPVIKKLTQKNIIKIQKGKNIEFYKIYHETLIEPLQAWNTIEKKRIYRHKLIINILTIPTTALLFFLTIIFLINHFNHHLRLAGLEGSQVEVYHGKKDWPDPFKQQQYAYETQLSDRDMEPDKRFQAQGILDYIDLNNELTGYRPIAERIHGYIEHGNFNKTVELADKAFDGGNPKISRDVLRGLLGLKTQAGFDLIKQLALTDKPDTLNDTALTLLHANTLSCPVDDLTPFQFFYNRLKQQDYGFIYSLGITDPRLVDKFIGDLTDKNSSVRSSAASALGRIGDPRAFDAIANAIKDENEVVRSSAADALGRIGDPRAFDALANAIKDENEVVRSSAASALGRIGDPRAFDAIANAIKDENEVVRSSAADALGRIGDPRAFDALANAIKDENEVVRSSAASALGRIGDPRAFDAIANAIKDENEVVRSSAASALGRIGDPRAFDALANAIKDENEVVRSSAADALGRIGDPRAFDALANAIKDENEVVRSSAASALGRIGDPRAFDAIANAIKDENEVVRSSAASALGRIGDPRAFDALANAIKDENEVVRSSAASALGRIGDPRAFEPLANAIKDENEVVRRNAAYALGLIGDPRAVDALANALKDENEDVRRDAADALGLIGNPSQIGLEEITLQEKTDTVTLADLFDEGISGSVNDRKALLQALNLSASPERNQQLLRLAQKTDAHLSIRRKAIETLAEAEDANLIEQLQPLKSHTQLNQTITELEEEVLPPQQILHDTSRKLSVKLSALKRLAKQDPTTAKQEVLRIIQQPEEDAFSNLAYRLLGDLQITDNGVVPLLQQRLDALDQQFRDWRKLRDSKPLSGLTTEQQDKVLAEIRDAKDAIKNQQFAFDYAYALAHLDPDIGKQLLTHNLADVRQGAYMGFAMKANIQTLKELDKEREARRDDPIFRHEAFRTIDIGLRRMEILGNNPKDSEKDKELKELQVWQQQLESAAPRTTPDDPDDEVLERLQWTTLMMEHYNKLDKEFREKYGKMRVWPEDTLPVNQPYPEK